MNISNVTVKLTGNDILSIINDFVNVEGLQLDNVSIDNGINIEGSFKKGIKLNFKGTISEIEVVEGKVHCRFSSFKVYKLGLFRMFRSLGVKIALKFIGDIGIDATRDKLIIDVDKILENVKIVKLKVESLNLVENNVVAEVKDIKITLGGNNEEEATVITEEINSRDKAEIKANDIEDIKEQEEVKHTTEEEKVEEVEAEIVDSYEEEVDESELNGLVIEEKTEDYYKKGREFTKKKLNEKLPKNAKQYSDYVFLIPDLIVLIGRLLKDERVPIKTKLTVSGSIAYLVFPTDLIPSKIPFIGKIDDLAVLFFALNKIAKDVPLNVIVENWSGKNELILVLRNGLEYVVNFTGAKNLDKIFNVVEELATL